jgi:hypothetical protein
MEKERKEEERKKIEESRKEGEIKSIISDPSIKNKKRVMKLLQVKREHKYWMDDSPQESNQSIFKDPNINGFQRSSE